MSIIVTMLKQKAVYWANPKSDGEGGFTFDDPVEIKCRWEDNSVRFVSSKGEELRSAAIVYVDRDMLIEEILWFGGLADLPEGFVLKRLPGTVKAKAFNKLPNIRATLFLRMVHCT